MVYISIITKILAFNVKAYGKLLEAEAGYTTVDKALNLFYILFLINIEI
jgi:hypothetical protein